jgi:hypothetical protein
MSPGAVALGTAENEFGRAKHENGTQRPRYRPKRVRESKNLKTGPDALGTEGNDSGSAKHENETRHPHFRRKRIREGKT